MKSLYYIFLLFTLAVVYLLFYVPDAYCPIVPTVTLPQEDVGLTKSGEDESHAGDAEKKSGETIYDIRQRVERAEKERFELLKLLAHIYSCTDRKEEAIAMYEKALLMEPTDRELVESLLKLYRESERWADMMPIYERLLEQYKGKNEQYYKELVVLYFKMEQKEKAFGLLERFVDEHVDSEETYRYVATVFMKHNERERVLETLRKGLDKFPDNFDLNRWAASTYMELEEYSEALKYFEAAKESTTSKSSKEMIDREMMALYEKADIVKDIIKKKAIELEDVETKLQELYLKQAEAKLAAGKMSEAIESYRKVVGLAPDTAEGKAALKKLKELKSNAEEN